MDAQRLSELLDTLIASLLAQRKQRLPEQDKTMLVVISGEDASTLPMTLDCLDALSHCGYALVFAFSCSARQSGLQTLWLEALAQRSIAIVCESHEPQLSEANYSHFYFPALSTNSLSKIALGIRDNLVCRWAWHALSTNKPAIVTLNAECQPDTTLKLPAPLQARLTRYLSILAEYGFSVMAPQHVNTPQPISSHKTLITVSDVRQYPHGQRLHISKRTLITPAARDEIRSRGLVIIESHQEDTCILPG